MKKIILPLIFIINSCSYPEMVRNELVYENNFENSDLSKIDGGGISEFNGSKVMGDFNNDGFTLFLDNIGKHDYVFISFDLYVHGSWDGNFNGFAENDKLPINGLWNLILIWISLRIHPQITSLQHFQIVHVGQTIV